MTFIGANRKPSEIAEEIAVQNTPTEPKVVKMEQAPTCEREAAR
jgi:hypothetical protein